MVPVAQERPWPDPPLPRRRRRAGAALVGGRRRGVRPGRRCAARRRWRDGERGARELRGVLAAPRPRAPRDPRPGRPSRSCRRDRRGTSRAPSSSFIEHAERGGPGVIGVGKDRERRACCSIENASCDSRVSEDTPKTCTLACLQAIPRVAERARLLGAARRPVLRIEVHDHGPTPLVGQPLDRAVLICGEHVGRCRADRDQPLSTIRVARPRHTRAARQRQRRRQYEQNDRNREASLHQSATLARARWDRRRFWYVPRQEGEADGDLRKRQRRRARRGAPGQGGHHPDSLFAHRRQGHGRRARSRPGKEHQKAPPRSPASSSPSR